MSATWVRILAICCLVGVVAGLGAIGFYWLLGLAKYVFLDCLAGYHPPGPGGEPPPFPPTDDLLNKWILLILPAAGGLVSGVIVYLLAPEAEGHGTDAAIDSFHHRHGRVRGRVPLIKAVSAAITIGTGGSGGREGPIAQIGSGFGSMLTGWLKLRPHEHRILMSAGTDAGIGAIFHAPLAGALFAAPAFVHHNPGELQLAPLLNRRLHLSPPRGTPKIHPRRKVPHRIWSI